MDFNILASRLRRGRQLARGRFRVSIFRTDPSARSTQSLVLAILVFFAGLRLQGSPLRGTPFSITPLERTTQQSREIASFGQDPQRVKRNLDRGTQERLRSVADRS